MSERFIIGKDCQIEKGATINVKEGSIGDRSIIRSGARIEGNYVKLGRECYLDHFAYIGGGSCWDSCAYLTALDWVHFGEYSQVNIARGVEIGNEVGIGIGSKIFTHGAYLPFDRGFPVKWAPVKIGNRVWLPNAWINPGVVIGDDVVIAAQSLVNKDLPDGCLAGGIPIKVLKENAYPNYRNPGEFVELFLPQLSIAGINDYKFLRGIIQIGDTTFDIENRTIRGPVTDSTERVKNQLRRNGIRFRFFAKDKEYLPWDED